MKSKQSTTTSLLLVSAAVLLQQALSASAATVPDEQQTNKNVRDLLELYTSQRSWRMEDDDFLQNGDEQQEGDDLFYQTGMNDDHYHSKSGKKSSGPYSSGSRKSGKKGSSYDSMDGVAPS